VQAEELGVPRPIGFTSLPYMTAAEEPSAVFEWKKVTDLADARPRGIW
jgi:hypothetical protein